MTIEFYRENDQYGFLSNFYEAEVYLSGKKWKTNEHYFQAMKFLDPSLQECVRSCTRPIDAKNIGNNRKLPLRKDWEEVKDGVMYDCCFAKFTQNKELMKSLLDTAPHNLVEHTYNDSYWGDAGDGSGRNMLGIILVRIRNEIKFIKEGK